MALSSMSELEVSCNFLAFPLRFPHTSFLLQWEQKLIAQDLPPPSPSHTTCVSARHTLSGKIKFWLCSWEMSSFAQTCACPVPTQAAMLGKAPGWSTWFKLVLLALLTITSHHAKCGHCGWCGGVTGLKSLLSTRCPLWNNFSQGNLMISVLPCFISVGCLGETGGRFVPAGPVSHPGARGSQKWLFWNYSACDSQTCVLLSDETER